MSAGWEPGLGDHLRIIWRHKWVLLVGAALVAEAVFLILSFAVSPAYEAESSLRLSVETDGGLLLDEERVEYATRIYAELAESPAVVAAAVEASGVAIEDSDASGAFDVQWARPPGFIDVTATADSAPAAADLADGMAQALVAVIVADSGQLAGDGADTVLVAEIVEPAIAPSGPASPRPIRDALAAFVISLVVLAEGVALWRPIRGLLPTSRTAERVTELVGIPCLSLTGDPEDRTRLGLFAARHLTSIKAAVMVHSNPAPHPAAAIRLGEAMTIAGRPALVVDAEPIEPSMHRWLALPRSPGLQEVMARDEKLDDVVFASQARAEVSLLTAGGADEGREPHSADDAMDLIAPGFGCVIAYIGSAAQLDGIAAAISRRRRSTILVIDPERTTRRGLAELVHGYGGHEDVVAILLMTKAAAAAESTRLAARWWKRSDTEGVAPASKPSKLGTIRAGRRAS